jgi:hypothetical protein
MSETVESSDLDREIAAKAQELARLRAMAKRRQALKQDEPAAGDWISGSQAIAEFLNKLSEPRVDGKPRWTAAKVQQDFRRGKVPPGAVWKFGTRTMEGSRRALRNLPALLTAMEAEKQANKAATAVTEPTE